MNIAPLIEMVASYKHFKVMSPLVYVCFISECTVYIIVYIHCVKTQTKRKKGFLSFKQFYLLHNN